MFPITMVEPSTSASFTATVVVAGVSIVLGMLIVLVVVFFLFGKAVSGAENRAKAKAQKKHEKAEQKSPAVLQSEVKETVVNSSPSPEVEEGISGEVVAAIAAAVAVQDSGAVVRSIKRKNVSGRNPWAYAAVADNTRPF